MATTTTLGKVSLTMGGNYSATAVYDRLTVVRGVNGNSYVTLMDGVSGISPGVTSGWQTYWQLFAEDGSGGGGGSTVTVTPIVTTGTKIATIGVDGTDSDLYAPNGGGSTVSVTQVVSTGTKIATVTVDGTGTDLYAPNGGDSAPMVSYTSIEMGSIGGTDGQPTNGDTRARTADYIPISTFVSCNLKDNLSSYQMIVFCYGSDLSYLGRIYSNWATEDIDREGILDEYSTTAFTRIIFKKGSSTLDTTDLSALHAAITVLAIETLQDANEAARRSRFDGKCKIVAYSKLSNDPAPINSRPHFEECAAASFDGIKGDIAITSDNRLIMCHDAGYTLDSNGKITTYDSSSSTAIRSMTYAQVRALTFAQQYNGQDVSPADIDDFLQVAKKYGKMPYIIIRDTYITIVIPALVEKLREYDLLTKCIVGSFSWTSIEMVRGCSPDIAVTWVTQYQSAPTTANIDRLNSIGNAALCIFDQGASISTNASVVAYAKKKNVRVWGAQATSKTVITNYLNAGYDGVQSYVEYAPELPVSVVTPASGSTFTLQPCPVTYNFGEKAELTVTVTALSQFHFMFSCPSSAATVLTINGETMRCGDELEPGETYEVDIWAGITRVAKVEGTAVT